ncbi:MAG: hypothetical protein KC731_33375, partial [Myxococcales bacterium]|nr:hypothetical protein [Myxococcales bacterium]
PYHQPLKRTSWLFYAEDFREATAGPELATYLFFHNERLGLSASMLAAGIHNLSYFLVRSPEEREAFAHDAARSTRPDAASFRALAEALPWATGLYHGSLRPPGPDAGELGRLEIADLLVPEHLKPNLQALASAFQAGAREVLARHAARYAPRGDDGAASEVVAWLKDNEPRLLVTAGPTILWSPERPGDLAALGEALRGIATEPAESLVADLAVIDARTRAFFDALVDEATLPDPHDLDQEAGTYVHATHKLIAYDLRHPEMNRLNEPSPPYERWMLAARTIHEWGHLAVDAEMVRVPDARRPAFDEAKAEVATLLDAIIGRASPKLQAVAGKEAQLLGGEGSPGKRLFAALLARFDDFAANLLARCFLTPEEMETYARANVLLLVQEPGLGPWLRLVRHAYEYQYLTLGGLDDPFDYFAGSLWLDQHLVDAGICSRDDARALVDAVSRVCATYAIDAQFFRPGALPKVAQLG